MKMRMLMDMGMKVDDTEYPKQAIPAIVMTLNTKVVSVSPEGEIRYDIAFSDCSVEAGGEQPEIAEMLKDVLAPLSKVSGTCLVTTRCFNKETKLNPPEGLDASSSSMFDNMKQQVGQIGSPFPEEAVGVGARWKVSSKIKSQEIGVDQVTTVELLEIKDGVARMSVSLEQTASAGQKLTPPGLPPGASLEVQSLKPTGSGKMEHALASVAPVSSAMKMGTDVSMKVVQGEEAHTMSQHIGLEMIISPGAEADKAEKPAEKPADKPAETPNK